MLRSSFLSAPRQGSGAGRCRSRRLLIESLEQRRLLAGIGGLQDWRSLVFDGEVGGKMALELDRDQVTVDPAGALVAASEPRFGTPRLLTEVNEWSVAAEGIGEAKLAGSGWDHDGQTPLAVMIDFSPTRVIFMRGTDMEFVNRRTFFDNGGDLLAGSVAGFRYLPVHAIVHEGLVMIMTLRERSVGSAWRPEGISFVYTQDYGASFHRVADVSGGFDVPGIAGGVADGIRRGREWSFANSFPENGPDDLLGVWFPWADYLHQSGDPKGGQVGLFRARRPAVGEDWVVEPNRVVYETWREDDSGGLHSHTAGMLRDGMASFWGDVTHRDHIVRHSTDDLENYTTATWTHKEDFQGAWSPENAKVWSIGNQAVSAAPGPLFGEILVAGDEQPEVVMSIQAPDDPNGKVVAKNLIGSFPGPQSGPTFTPRLSLWLHHLRGGGYIAREFNVRIDDTTALYYSPDGENWGIVTNMGSNTPFLYGNRILATRDGAVYGVNAPSLHDALRPLLINPGGTNLAKADWDQVDPPAAGNQMRRVAYVGGEYVYADSGESLSSPPDAPPPVTGGAPIWEITSDGTSLDLGTWQITDTETAGNATHWFSAWYYSLDGNGISPKLQFGDNIANSRASLLRSTVEWRRALDFGKPASKSTTPQRHEITFMTGRDPAPRRYLMAVESYTQDDAPPYPLDASATGSPELARILGVATQESWSVALTFALPETSSFSTQFDPLGPTTMHPVATLRALPRDDYIEIALARTARGDGMLVIDRYTDHFLVDRMTFSSLTFDRLDPIRLVISHQPEHLAATVMTLRDEFSLQSREIVGSQESIQPFDILLSDATQTQVTPLEWYAVQTSSSQFLDTAQREEFIVTDLVFERLDSPFPVGADFDQDGDVDGGDFVDWQAGFGTAFLTRKSDGDANGDGTVNDTDFVCWQRESQRNDHEPSADFDGNGQINGADLATWQDTFPVTCGAAHAEGDGDVDGDVDGDDFLAWQLSAFSSTSASAAAIRAIPSADNPTHLANGISRGVAQALELAADAGGGNQVGEAAAARPSAAEFDIAHTPTVDVEWIDDADDAADSQDVARALDSTDADVDPSDVEWEDVRTTVSPWHFPAV